MRDYSFDPDRRLICDLGKVRFLSELAHLGAARDLLENLHEDYPRQFSKAQPQRITTAIRAATNRAHGRLHARVVNA